MKFLILFLMFFSIQSFGGTKTSDLPSLTNDNLASDDLFQVVDTGSSASKKISVSELSLRWLTSSFASATTTTGIVFDNEAYAEFQERTANGNNYVRLKAPASLSSNYTYTLPNSYGSSGQYLKTDGAGGLSWFTVPSSVNSVFGRTGDVAAVSGDYEASEVTNSPSGSISGATVQAALNELDSEKLALTGGNLTGDLGLGNESELQLKEATGNGTNYVAFKAPASLSENTTYVLPDADGSTGQTLQTDGSGNISWSSPAGGTKSYIEVASAQVNSGIGGWSTDDGAGGSADYLTLSIESSAPLAGAGSLKVAKSASDATGEYIKLTTQAIDLTDRGKTLFGSFSYDATDASYTSDDFIIEIYDLTNSSVLYSGLEEDLEILNIKGRFDYAVSTEATTESIEVRLKVNSTNASAYSLYFDEFTLGPASSVVAPIATQWRPYASTISNVTGTSTFVYRRKGDSIDVRGSIEFTGAASGDIKFTLPSGLAIDNAKLQKGVLNGGDLQVLGAATGRDNSPTGYWNGKIINNGGTNNEFVIVAAGGPSAGASSAWGISIPITWQSGDHITVELLDLPIAGWSSGGLVGSNELSQQTVRAQYTATTASANTSFADAVEELADFNLKIRDTHNAVTTGAAWKFTAPKTADYKVDIFFSWINPTNLDLSYMELTKNGSFLRRISSTQGDYSLGGSTTVTLSKGDYISVKAYQNDTTGAARGIAAFSGGFTNITIESLPDYTVIGAIKEKNTVQTLKLTSDVSSDGTMTDLTASNLIVGKWYEVNAHFYVALDASSSGVSVGITGMNNGSLVYYDYIRLQEATDTNSDDFILSKTFKFQAAATTLTFVPSGSSANAIIRGDNSLYETHIQIEERNDLVETDKH